MKTRDIIQNIVRCGVRSDQSNVESHRIIFFNNALLYSLLLVSLNAVYDIAYNSPHVIILDVLLIANFGTILLLNRLHCFRTAIFLYFVLSVLLLASFSYYMPNVGVENFLIPLIFIATQLILDKILLVVLIVYYVSVFVFLKSNSVYKYFVASDASLSYADYYVNLVFNLTIITFLTYNFARNNEKLINSTETKNRDLERQNELVNNLLRELNHRVKNNLQLISSLFNIQAYKTQNAETKTALNDARNRIASIAIVHSKLYKDDSIFEVHLDSYLNDLCEYLIQSMGSNDKVQFEVYAEDINFQIRETVHVGLIVNELITNTLKYGVKSGKNCLITLHVSKSPDNTVTLKYKDNGMGFPWGFSLNQINSFGFDLVKTISEQYDGELRAYNDDGAVVEMNLRL